MPHTIFAAPAPVDSDGTKSERKGRGSGPKNWEHFYNENYFFQLKNVPIQSSPHQTDTLVSKSSLDLLQEGSFLCEVFNGRSNYVTYTLKHENTFSCIGISGGCRCSLAFCTRFRSVGRLLPEHHLNRALSNGNV